jgi:lipoprotein-releasing system permease protein
VGIDDATYASVSDFGKYLQHPANRERLSFTLREDGYDVRDHQLGEAAPVREEMKMAGWKWRRLNAHASGRAGPESYGPLRPESDPNRTSNDAGKDGAGDNSQANSAANNVANDSAANNAGGDAADDGSHNPFTERWAPEIGASGTAVFDPAKEQNTGIVLGIALASYRIRDIDGVVKSGFYIRPGDDVRLTFPSSGTPPKGVNDTFTVVDFYESKMYEYDSTTVFVPIRKLQELRGMIDPSSGVSFVSTIRIQLRPGADGPAVRDKLRAATMPDGRPLFPPAFFHVNTWRDQQGPLLAAVEMETATLNILLFMIIAVAGFGILATFFMIVVEKTKDIGILKSLGASAGGVMGIFLSYGLSLGTVGAGAGLAIGLLFIRYINQVRRGVEWITGREVFDQTIYYFNDIPTIVSPPTIACVLGGAVGIAVLASVLPALRAALLHPVDALRA